MTTAVRPYTIIEAGFAGWPSIGVAGRRQLEVGQMYIGLGLFDTSTAGISPMQLAEGAGTMMDILNMVEPGTRQVVVGDVTRMPFPDDTADEIIAANLVADPRFVHFEEAATEMKRVVRPLGSLIVVETITPNEIPAASLARRLDPYGFEFVNPGSAYDPHLVSQYSDVEGQAGYVAMFRQRG